MRLILIALLFPILSYGQITQRGLYQIYERQGPINTALRLNKDSTYSVYGSFISCSLCDHDSLSKSVFQKGRWEITQDTLILFDIVNNSINKLKIENSETLKPLYFVERFVDDGKISKALSDTLYQRGIVRGQKYFLTTETFDSGEVERIIPRDYDGKMTGFEIKFDKAGRVWDINKFKKGKYKGEVR